MAKGRQPGRTIRRRVRTIGQVHWGPPRRTVAFGGTEPPAGFAGRQEQTRGDPGTQSHGTRSAESAGLPKPSEVCHEARQLHRGSTDRCCRRAPDRHDPRRGAGGGGVRSHLAALALRAGALLHAPGAGRPAPGAEAGSRTLTPSRAADFKSAASAIPPLRPCRSVPRRAGAGPPSRRPGSRQVGTGGAAKPGSTDEPRLTER